MAASELKTCPTCGLEQSTKNFHKDPQRSDGLAWDCKTCRGGKDRSIYLQKREEAVLRNVLKKYDPELVEAVEVLAKEDVRTFEEEVVWVLKDYVRYVRCIAEGKLEEAKEKCRREISNPNEKKT